jgi:hypothetical protein
MERKELTQRIKADYGTVKRFCEVMGINYKTYNCVLSGHSRSKKVVDTLISIGYVKSEQQFNMIVW